MKGMAYHGWKRDLPAKFWPVSLDNFFDNPDEIRELGLRMMKSAKKPKDNIVPGYRSEELYKRDEGLSLRIIEKLLSCYFNLDLETVFWDYYDIRFQLISSFDKDKNNIKNKGWIHRDGIDPRRAHHPNYITTPRHVELAGLIYLTPDIEPDTGTSLFNMKKDQTLKLADSTVKIRQQINLSQQSGDPINEEEVEEMWKKQRSCFIEKIRFENIYNRLIMYDTQEFHAANSYYTSKDNRLVLGFFIDGIKANKWPLERVRNI